MTNEEMIKRLDYMREVSVHSCGSVEESLKYLWAEIDLMKAKLKQEMGGNE